MAVAQVELGSVSDLVSVGLALATAVASVVAYVLRGRNRKLKEEAKRLRTELETRNLALEEQQRTVDLERSRASTFDELSDQARLVSVVVERDECGLTTFVVVNGSDSPIFALEARLFMAPGDIYTNWVPSLAARSRYETSAGTSSPMSCDLRFRDFRGRFWRLDGFGVLTPLEGYVPRVGAVPPGYFED